MGPENEAWQALALLGRECYFAGTLRYLDKEVLTGSPRWIKDKSHTQSLFTLVNFDKTEMEESETEGSD